jgi:2-(1,2-epoxy-1,2-dihydrophenyl)acetyl-CoA isomerase
VSDTVLVTREGGVAIVTLNRPDRLNAIDSELMEYLPGVLRNLASNHQVGCVVLTGAGRGFCAGGDLKSRQAELDAQALLSDEERQALSMPHVMDQILKARVEASRLLHDMPKPTIAMINGPCAGAGLSMAGACDMRFAAESAVLTSAFTRAGLSGDYGGTWFWSQILGTAKARELYFLSEKIAAPDALSRGIVNRVWADTELRDRTMEIAHALADGPRWSFAYAKRNLNLAETASLDQVLQSEATTMQIATRTVRDTGRLPVSVLNKTA